MPYKHIYAPIKGLINAVPATMLPAEASPSMSGVILKDGEVSSEFGHTPYPTAGALKTNLVNGTVMRIDEFTLYSGVSHLVALTTTNAYEYNTSTTTWDCITKGQTLEDCEDAWVASANITCTADTAYKLRGNKSAKQVIAAGFTTGLAAYENISSTDVSAETGVHFWIYSTVATSAGDLKLRISEQTAGGTGATYEDLSIPALTADTWTPVYIAYGTPADLDAVLSVGLVVDTDLGAMTVYIDDVRSVDAFTGDEDNLFSVDFLNDTMLITNGVNQPQKYTGTVATGLEDLSTNLATCAITTSELVFVFKDHVCFCNNTENAADAPNRVSWSNVGQIEDYTGGTAGYQDLTDDESSIVTGGLLTEDVAIIYKGDSIVKVEWVGGQTPFRFTTAVKEKTIAGKSAFLNINGVHHVTGTKDIYTYTGGGEESLKAIAGMIKRTFFDVVDYTYIARMFMIHVEEDDEIQFWIPTTTAHPDTVYCVDPVLGNWYKRDRTMNGHGFYSTSSALTIGDLVGNIGDQNFTFGSTVTKANTPITLVGNSSGKIFKLDKATYNNDGTAITNEFETPDFVYPDQGPTEYVGRFFRVPQLLYEAKGQSITTDWSDDGGATWHPTELNSANTVTLESIYALYQQDMDATVRKIRFRFRNTTASSNFILRYYGFKWFPRSVRR